MAGFDDVSQIIPASAVDNINAAKKAIIDSLPALAKYIESARMAAETLGDTKGLTALLSAQARADAAQAKLIKANLDLTKTSTEAAKADLLAAKASNERAKASATAAKEADRVTDRANKAAAAQQREATGASSLSTAYGRLKADYKAAADAAKEYAASLGLTDPVSVTAIKNAKALHDQLALIEGAVGQNQRNVGNYKSGFDGLSNSMQQILREAPSAAISLNTFFLAISNNLPTFFDEIAKASKGTSELAESVKAATAAQAAAESVQNTAARAAEQTTEAVSDQVDAIVGSISATVDQKIALKEQIAEQIAASTASLEAAEAAAINTEALLLNAGASAEDAAAVAGTVRANGAASVASGQATAALNAQTIATAEATAAAAAQPGVFARIVKSLFSVNTALTLAVLALTLFGGELFAATKATEGTTKALDALDEVATDGSQALAKVSTEIETLKKRFFDANATIEDQTRVVKELNDKYGDNIGQLKGVSDAEDFFINRSQAFIEATFLRAKAQAALNAIMKATEANINAQSETFVGTGDVIGAILKNPFSFGGVSGAGEDLGNKNIEKRTEAIKKNNKVVDDAKKKYEEYSKEADDLAKKYNFDFGKKERDTKEKTVKEKKEKGFPELSMRIKAETDTNEQIIQKTRDFLAERAKLYAGDMSAIKAARSEDETQERVALSNRYSKGLVSEQQYRAQLAAINDKYDLEELQALKDRTGGELIELGKLGYDTTELQKQYHDLEVALNKEKNDQIIADDEAAAARRIELQKKVVELAQEVYQSFKTIANAQFEKRISDLDQESQAIDKAAEKEINKIENSAATEEEKQERVKIAEAKAQAAREDIEARQKTARRDQAKFERATTIAEIIAKTALAVISQLSIAGAGIGLAAVVAAIGAVQLATVLATPLPAYAEGAGIDGKAKHKGGLALVGDNKAGTELILEPGRNPYAVHGEQIKDLRAGTTVIPQERLDALGYSVLSSGLVRSIQGQKAGKIDAAMAEAMRTGFGRVERAVKGSKPTINIHGGWQAYIDANMR